MDGMTTSSSSTKTGAVELILSDIHETMFSTVEYAKRFLYSIDVTQSVDLTTMLILFWILFGLAVYAIGNILFLVLNKRQNRCKSEIADKSSDLISDHKNDSFAENSNFSVNDSSVVPQQCLATGPNSDAVRWINNIITWLYSQNETNIHFIQNSWLSALNLKCKQSFADNGFFIEFVRVITEQSFRPILTDVKVNLESNQVIVTTCKICLPRFVLHLKAIREDEDVLHYELHIERFEGMMEISCNSDELLFGVRFIERPDVKLTLKTVKNPQLSTGQRTKGDNRITDSIIDVILNTITSTVVDLCFSSFYDFPKYYRNLEKKNLNLDVSSLPIPKDENIERKLFVKVVKSNNLGVSKGCVNAYCVIEVDEPSQRMITSTIKETSNPVWNEHFIFNLQKESSEILFEIYDKSIDEKNGADKFLGLGIVSVEELKLNPSQKQVITLQSRPLENDDISGSLSVEFLFMEHSSTPLRESPLTEQLLFTSNLNASDNGVSSGGTLITKSTINNSLQSKELMLIYNPPENNVEADILTTLERATAQISQSEPICTQADGKHNQTNANNSLNLSGIRDNESLAIPDNQSFTDGSTISSTASSTLERKSRSRSKEPRAIIKAIRRKLSFNKNRSKSVEIRIDKEEEMSSRDSSVSSTTSDRARSMPGSREPSSAKDIVLNNGEHSKDSRSNLSEISGYSSKTFVHEKSTLVIEIDDFGIKSYFVIPASLINKRKWRKRGVKLHLYNEHIFVAKHISGSITCQVCSKLFSRRPGKQAYQCRDCNYMSHKRCHINVELRCPTSTLSSLKLEYVNDPKASSDAKIVTKEPIAELS